VGQGSQCCDAAKLDALSGPAADFLTARLRGSHHVFKHPTKPGIIFVPHPKKDLGVGLVAPIRAQAGL
jgi:predicted RNA binding protein YcfA (HicA-like mRNA interferase family)